MGEAYIIFQACLKSFVAIIEEFDTMT